MTTRRGLVVEEEKSALVPRWLEPLLAASFFSPCATHRDAPRPECNMFCLDCPASSSFCFYCRSAAHTDHRVIQIRRSSYHDVVRVSEVQRALDIGGVQTYVINSARVVFLNERPQPRGGPSSSSSSLVTGGPSKSSAAHSCEICSRTLLDPFRFCSLGCKLQGINRNGDASFVLDDEAGDRVDEAAAAARRRAADRRRSGEVGGLAAGRGEGEGLRERAGHATSPPANPRRRKGIPRRAPLAP